MKNLFFTIAGFLSFTGIGALTENAEAPGGVLLGLGAVFLIMALIKGGKSEYLKRDGIEFNVAWTCAELHEHDFEVDDFMSKNTLVETGLPEEALRNQFLVTSDVEIDMPMETKTKKIEHI